MLGFVVSDEALSHVLNWILTNKHKTMIKLVLKIRCKGFIYLIAIENCCKESIIDSTTPHQELGKEILLSAGLK